jgi:hypothetical protein
MHWLKQAWEVIHCRLDDLLDRPGPLEEQLALLLRGMEDCVAEARLETAGAIATQRRIAWERLRRRRERARAAGSRRDLECGTVHELLLRELECAEAIALRGADEARTVLRHLEGRCLVAMCQFRMILAGARASLATAGLLPMPALRGPLKAVERFVLYEAQWRRLIREFLDRHEC